MLVFKQASILTLLFFFRIIVFGKMWFFFCCNNILLLVIGFRKDFNFKYVKLNLEIPISFRYDIQRLSWIDLLTLSVHNASMSDSFYCCFSFISYIIVHVFRRWVYVGRHFLMKIISGATWRLRSLYLKVLRLIISLV